VTLRLATGLGLAALLAVAATLYLTRLSFVPPYLMQDEVNFALQAHSIATTARDTNGRLLPVFFSEVGFEAGRDPLMIYWTALFLTVQPLSEAAVRFPSALLGVLTIALLFVLVRWWTTSDLLALVAAGCLALTPGYFTNMRLALSHTYGIPFSVLWLMCMHRALGAAPGWACAAGAMLGLGTYSYLGNTIVMPTLLATGMVVLYRSGQTRAALWSLAGFAILMAPLAYWLLHHPDRFTQLFAVYRPADGWAAWRDRLSAYWMFFNPDYLFVSGDGRMTNSTRAAGLLPLAFALLLPLGVYRLIKGDGGRLGWLIVAGFFLTPLASALSGRLEINRVQTAIPFAVLTTTAGAAAWLRHPGAGRWTAAALIAAVVLQFGVFYRDYVGSYRSGSSRWFGGDQSTAIRSVLDRLASAPARVYLDRRTPIERYWLFYAAQRGRLDLVDWPTYYTGVTADMLEAPRDSLLICEPLDPVCQTIARDSRWNRADAGRLPDGTISHEVWVKQR